MALSLGMCLGPYEILAPLGAGGMGEVYRARDPRLGREVAVKVLPASFSNDPDRLRRFEQEARAAGVLNHPNITAVYDIGTHEGAPYVVTELLEGETLRSRLAGGAFSPRKALGHALQIAHGLAAAHERGIVHRDLKPENLFVTTDGRVKILDFGLAKLTHTEEGGGGTNLPTATAGTEPGVVLGTLGYMSPEQVRGRPADQRSDIFAFGAILYEILTGKRAFQGDSAADTMSAILKEDPPDLSLTGKNISPGLERIVWHCLEKNPEERFHSAHDLAFDLEAVSGLSGVSAAPAVPGLAVSRRRFRLALLGLAVLAAISLAFLAGRSTSTESPSPPSFHQLTFRRGAIRSARFAHDGQTVVYGASWDGNPVEIFSTRPESPESRPLGLSSSDILGISASGEMALLLRPGVALPRRGMLARAPLAGGVPREILEEVSAADWAPDGSTLAVVRHSGGRARLEFPPGKLLYETTGNIVDPRVSPKGDLVAFLDRPILGADDGSVAIVDLAGKKKTLSQVWNSTDGLAWAPSGEEVWFTATQSGTNSALWGVTLSGKERLVARVSGRLSLQDISRDGRVLLAHINLRMGILGLAAGETKERDLSWFDRSIAADISSDGKALLFSEHGEGGGPNYSVYLRKTDGSPAVRLGDGAAAGLSPDGKWALSRRLTSPPQIVLLPTGAGDARALPRGPMAYYHEAGWFPGGKRILLMGNEAGRGRRVYVQDLEGGAPRPVTPEGASIARTPAISPDGKLIAAVGPDRKVWLYPVEEGADSQPRPAAGLSPGDFPIRWSEDGRFLYVARRGELPYRAQIFRLDLARDRKELWREIGPYDPTGIGQILTILVAHDGKSYAYTYTRGLSELYLVEGLK